MDLKDQQGDESQFHEEKHDISPQSRDSGLCRRHFAENLHFLMLGSRCDWDLRLESVPSSGGYNLHHTYMVA